MLIALFLIYSLCTINRHVVLRDAFIFDLCISIYLIIKFFYFEGFTVCASGTPSIPSRYLTIISSNTEKRGFQQTAKRFQYDIVYHPLPISSNRYFDFRRILHLVLDNIKPFNH